MQSIHQKLSSHLSFLLKTGGGRMANRQNCVHLFCVGVCDCLHAWACLDASIASKVRQNFWFNAECWNTCTGELCPLDGTVMSFLQSISNNQFMCGVVCQKWGNINFFALGNLNISRNDINTITTGTHTNTRPSLISPVTGLYPLAPILQ